MRPMAGKLSGEMAERLSRLGAAYRRSKEAYDDDKTAVRAALRDADTAGVPVRDAAAAVGLSPSHTHRLMVGIGTS